MSSMTTSFQEDTMYVPFIQQSTNSQQMVMTAWKFQQRFSGCFPIYLQLLQQNASQGLLALRTSMGTFVGHCSKHVDQHVANDGCIRS